MRVIGLQRKTVALAPHNKAWGRLFEQEKKRLQKVFGKGALDIQHEGSTSVPGLMAKPIIDVLVGMKSLKNGKQIVKVMERVGYHWRPNWGRLDQHILFAKGNEKSRTHYIHVVKYQGAIWKRDLLFRDYLRLHPARAKQYEVLKRKLSKKYPNDRPTYTSKKTEFIRQSLKFASSR